MTALDQAFIKAFSHQDPIPLALAPRPAAPKREEPPLEEEVAGDQWPVASEPCFLADEPSVVVGPAPLSSSFTSESTETFITSPLPTLDEVWTALEETPKAPENLSTTTDPVDEEQGPRGRGQGSEPVVSSQGPGASKSPNLQISKSDISNPESPIPFPPPQRAFKPAWQVDHFTWPKLCRRLIDRASDELDRLAEALLAAVGQGQKVLAIGGCRRGEGATTLLLCAVRRLAERAVRPILVDADLDQPRLAKRLGVQPQFGWDETTEEEEGRSLDQAIVEATVNNVSLLPVREPSEAGDRAASDPSRLGVCLGTLRDHYDVVLVDLGPLEDARLADGSVAAAIDAVVLVHNGHVTSKEEQRAIEERLAAAGIAVAGIVENFVVED